MYEMSDVEPLGNRGMEAIDYSIVELVCKQECLEMIVKGGA